MTTYFPVFYPDELVYSLLSRFCIEGGYISSKYAHSLIFAINHSLPSRLYLDRYNDDINKLLPARKILIEQHTMFPFYYKFSPMKKKMAIFNSFLQGEKPSFKKNKNQYLSFCPICAKLDREKYGITYWHRIHQMKYVNICPIHHCYLIKTIISLESDRHLFAAEMVIPYKNEIKFCNDDFKNELATYTMDVFLSPLKLNTETTISKFLLENLDYEYKSARSLTLRTKIIYKHLQETNQNLMNEYKFTKKTLDLITGNALYDLDIFCFLTFFMGISSNKLINYIPSKENISNQVCKEMFRLYKNGYSCIDIAKKFHTTNTSVGIIVKNIIKKDKLSSHPLVVNWNELDEEYLPLVKKKLKGYRTKGVYNPNKIQISAIEQQLNLPSKYINAHMPKCKKEIEKAKDWTEIDEILLPLIRKEIEVFTKMDIYDPNKITIKEIEQRFNLAPMQISRYLPKCKKEIERAKDWNTLDNKILPLVKGILKKMNIKDVSVAKIEQQLNLPKKQILNHLPKCKKEIENAKKTNSKCNLS